MILTAAMTSMRICNEQLRLNSDAEALDLLAQFEKALPKFGVEPEELRDFQQDALVGRARAQHVVVRAPLSIGVAQRRARRMLKMAWSESILG